MKVTRRYEQLFLFLGDVALFYVALFATLTVRNLSIPSASYIDLHLIPFSILFAVWVAVFLIVGLYEQYTRLLRSRLPRRIISAQTINVIVAAVFFFLVPYFAITPKTNLFIYLVISSALIIVWRLYVFPFFLSSKRYKAILIDGGKELKELHDEINNNSRYSIEFSSVVDVNSLEGSTVSDRLFSALKEPGVSIVVLNTMHPKLAGILPHLYKPIYSNVQFIDASELYEDIFERVPSSAINTQHFIDQLPYTSKAAYDTIKRGIDIVAAVIGGIITLPLYPFVMLAIKLEDGGDIFVTQERIGERAARITLYKFRSMQTSDRGSWENNDRITRVGHVLRKTRIDELPQLWSVLRGDISLIGPRPDIIGLYEQLVGEIPHYNLRYTIKPGLSGWAQIKQRYDKGNISPQSIEETRVRLQYDLYYIKHRSLILDVVIMLRTAWVVFGTSGS